VGEISSGAGLRSCGRLQATRLASRIRDMSKKDVLCIRVRGVQF